MSTFRFQNFIPELVKNLLIINVLMYFGTWVLKGNDIDLYRFLALFYIEDPRFQPYQLITHMFMHGGTWHLFFNMFALWMFGSNLERFWGPRRFFIFYMITGLGAALIHMLSLYFMLEYGDLPYAGATVGASGAIYGVLAAFTMYWPNTRLFILFIPFPVKAKYAILFMVIIELTLGFGNFSWDNIAHFAHLGGALFGFIMVKIWNKTNRNSLY